MQTFSGPTGRGGGSVRPMPSSVTGSLRPVLWPLLAVLWGGSLAAAPAASTVAMAARLRGIHERSSPMRNPFASDRRAEILAQRLAATTDPGRQVVLQRELGVELLNAGRSEEAIGAFRAYERAARLHAPDDLAANRALVLLHLATAWIRLGEQENCLANHNAESCLFPIRARGVHQLPRGSLGAIAVLEPALEEFPDDLALRWLLNVAYMTLGRYPDDVPARWRVDPARLASEAPMARFPEVAGPAGLDVEGLSGGVALDDFDGDGRLDVLCTGFGPMEPMRYFRNEGDGRFTDRTEAAGLAGLTGGLNVVTADYDNDGWLDVLVLRGAWMGREGRYPNSLLRNRGDGTFEDVTEAAGLLSFHPTQAAAWLDFDGDGWLDLFIGNESQPRDLHRCELYRNRGDGTFTDVAAASGVALAAFVKGVAVGDYDDDGRPDLYLTTIGEPNVLLRNEGPVDPANPSGPWRFSDQASARGVTGPEYAFPTWFFDYDQDGRLDLFVGGYRTYDVGTLVSEWMGIPSSAERLRLYRNLGGGGFAEAAPEVGLDRVVHAMGANFGDLDNDGWLDLYLGTGDPPLSTLVPNRAFLNQGGRRFADVTAAAGLGHLQKGHGIAFGDIDNDGDQDLYAVMGGAVSGDVYRNALFLNPGSSHAWVTLRLVGRRSPRDAHGARVMVETAGPGGVRRLYRWVGSVGSFGASPLRQEIGLGDATGIARVEIRWPADGRTQVITNIAPRGFWEIDEDRSGARRLDLRPFVLPSHPESVVPPPP